MKLHHHSLLVILLLIIAVACHDKKGVLKPRIVLIESTDHIIPLEDSLVKPILYYNVPELQKLPVKEAKSKFLAIVLPAVLIAKHHMAEDRKNVALLTEKERWTAHDSVFFELQKKRFKASDQADLLIRMETHPNSIVLAQAAVESGWGSSRFFKEANNLFGIWAYTPNEPRIAADGGDVYLRRYADISQSIEDYFVTIGRARPYRQFRNARADSSSVNQLLPHLKYYSERGLAYVNQLKTVIRQNNLTQYDHYQIDPAYFFAQ